MKRLVLFSLFVFLLGSVGYAALATDDIAVHADFARTAGVKVDASGDLVPITDSQNDLGETGLEFAELHVDEIKMGSNYKYAYMPISAKQEVGGSGAVITDGFVIGGIAEDLTAAGVTGIMELGTTEGYITMNEAADSMTFYVVLPELFVDGGSADDLVFGFDLSEGAAASGQDSYDLIIYEDGSETGALSTQNLSMSATTRAWVDATGIGDDVSISGADKVLILNISPEAAGDDMEVFGARLKYKTGIDNQ